MRPLVSYDDISLPYQSDSIPAAVQAPSTKPPPLKKRKRSGHKGAARNAQHWDEPVPPEESADLGGEYGSEEEDEDGRELSYEEIWDDSVLIDAWNAAAEEYQAYHGPDKGWKKEPVHKSPLWYNVPPSAPKKKKAKTEIAPSASHDAPSEPNPEGDSQPLDFNTFVPTHDASLDLPVLAQPPVVPGPDYAAQYLPGPPGPRVSRDEAFARALGAMYWGGYWTAMYHCQADQGTEHPTEANEEGEENEDDAVDGQEYEEYEDSAVEEGGEFVPTDR